MDSSSDGTPARPERVERLRSAGQLVFLCSGNVVRSAFAELYARHLGCPLPVASAATVYRNRGIFPEAERALVARGVDPARTRAFRPRHLEDVARALSPDAVLLGMRWHHLEALEPWPHLARRGMLLIEDEEIADPVLEGADFAATFDRVQAGVEALLGELGQD